jgi:hypothetical protein
MGVNYTNWPYNIPNGHEIYQHLPFKGPPQFTQIGIFVLKTNHLATLLGSEPGTDVMISEIFSPTIKQKI